MNTHAVSSATAPSGVHANGMTGTIIVSWFCRIIAAGILGYSAVSKFIGSELSIFIFERIGVEPWGRFLTGGIEAFAAIALLVPMTAWLGATVALAVMAGALATHAFLIGFAIQQPDGGESFAMFAMAVLVTVCALTVAFLHRRDLPFGPWGRYHSDPGADPDVQASRPPRSP